jgi:hypothetical protein
MLSACGSLWRPMAEFNQVQLQNQGSPCREQGLCVMDTVRTQLVLRWHLVVTCKNNYSYYYLFVFGRLVVQPFGPRQYNKRPPP